MHRGQEVFNLGNEDLKLIPEDILEFNLIVTELPPYISLNK